MIEGELELDRFVVSVDVGVLIQRTAEHPDPGVSWDHQRLAAYLHGVGDVDVSWLGDQYLYDVVALFQRHLVAGLEFVGIGRRDFHVGVDLRGRRDGGCRNIAVHSGGVVDQVRREVRL